MSPVQAAAVAESLGGEDGEHWVPVTVVWARKGREAEAMEAICRLREGCSVWEAVARIETMVSQTQAAVAAVGKEFHEVRTAKERLEAMQREQLFAFTQRIDPETFRILCTVLAQGTVAKASRVLKMRDATLRSRIAKWDTGDAMGKAMVAMVAWAKSMGRHQAVPLNPAITQGTAPVVDFPGLLSDVLDGLLEMNPADWRNQAETLAALLRPYVPR